MAPTGRLSMMKTLIAKYFSTDDVGTDVLVVNYICRSAEAT